MTPNEVQVSGRRPHNRDRIRQVQASESVPVKWAQVTGMSGWASLAHLGSHSGNQAQVSLTVFFMPAIRAQGAVQQYPEKGCVDMSPSVALPASVVTAHPSSWRRQVGFLPHRPLASSLRESEREREKDRPGRPTVSGPRGSGHGVGGRARLTGKPRCPGFRGGA